MDKNTSDISIFVKSYWNYFLELEEEFKQTQKYVSFDKYNEKTYSVEYLKLIQAVCSEIDVVAKAIAEHFDPQFHAIKHPNISHWGYVLCNHMPQLSSFSVRFNDDIDVTPWKDFGYTQYYDKNDVLRYRLADGCKTLKWWKDYNNMKHARTTFDSNGIMNFTRASLKNMILSYAALYALETLYINEITPEEGPDCNIEESQLF